MENSQYKFRAWDSQDKTMIDNPREALRLMLTCYKPRYTIMQFTGLLDKTGREIYEGDILSGLDFNGCPSTARVIFYLGAFSLEFEGYMPCLWEADERYISVSGNIWENPELLEKKK